MVKRLNSNSKVLGSNIGCSSAKRTQKNTSSLFLAAITILLFGASCIRCHETEIGFQTTNLKQYAELGHKFLPENIYTGWIRREH